MQLLSNFDTQYYAKLWNKNLKIYNEEDLLIINRHYIYLIFNFYKIFILIGIFAVLMYLTYIQYNSNPVILGIIYTLYGLTLGYFFVVLFRLFLKKYIHFNNIKTTLTKKEKNERDGYFEHFVKVSLILLVTQILLGIGIVILNFLIDSGGWSVNFLISLSQLVLNVLFVVVLYYSLIMFIDYEMDFTLVTPDSIFHYEQTGFFGKSSRTLDVDKLKTISAEKSGLIQSIFNYGAVNFLSEGDRVGNGDIQIRYVHSPGDVESKIRNIVNKYGNYQGNGNHNNN